MCCGNTSRLCSFLDIILNYLSLIINNLYILNKIVIDFYLKIWYNISINKKKYKTNILLIY